MRLVKPLSWRTRSISAARASRMSAFTLMPRVRATTSAVSASSSGRRTVVVLRVMQSGYQAIGRAHCPSDELKTGKNALDAEE